MSIASRSGYLALAEEFAWIGTSTAAITFAVAAVIEIFAYFVPIFDNALDTLAIPAALVAGTIATASQVGELPPLLQWTTAIVAGGGAASAIQVGTVGARATSTGLTGGIGNFVVSLIELVASLVITLLAIAAPFVGLFLAMVAVALLVTRFVTRRRKARRDNIRARSNTGAVG